MLTERNEKRGPPSLPSHPHSSLFPPFSPLFPSFLHDSPTLTIFLALSTSLLPFLPTPPLTLVSSSIPLGSACIRVAYRATTIVRRESDTGKRIAGRVARVACNFVETLYATIGRRVEKMTRRWKISKDRIDDRTEFVDRPFFVASRSAVPSNKVVTDR